MWTGFIHQFAVRAGESQFAVLSVHKGIKTELETKTSDIQNSASFTCTGKLTNKTQTTLTIDNYLERDEWTYTPN